MNEFYQNKYIQTAKDFDVFISHSIANTALVDRLLQHLNDLGLVAFVDWKNDSEDLKRSKSNQFTAEVIKLRLRQSKSLLLIRSKESDSSIWVAWELGYFSALNRQITIFETGGNLDDSPEFIGGYSKVEFRDSKLQVSDGEFAGGFVQWLNRERKVEHTNGRPNRSSFGQDQSADDA